MAKVHDKAPWDLKHKPLYSVDYYGEIDGHYKEGTDVQALSFGRAQWLDKDDDFVPSLKVWRMVNERWSRQSEELLITRVIDLNILLLSILNNDDSDDIPNPFGQMTKCNVKISKCYDESKGENDKYKRRFDAIKNDTKKYFAEHKSDIDEHLMRLKIQLDNYKF